MNLFSRVFSACAATAIGCVLLCAPAAHADSARPSFACGPQNNRFEAAICADPGLAADDARLAQLYAAVKTSPVGGASNQLAAQREWLKIRDADCAKKTGPALTECLTTAYRTRLDDIAPSAMFTAPEAALADIRQSGNGEAAPVYEAILRYATLDDVTARTQAVAALLAPLYAKLEPGERAYFADQGIATPQAAAASDKAFGTFVTVWSVDIDNAGVFWPCAAFVKRPGLLAAEGQVFGGQMDAQVPRDDCDAMLPAVPEVTAILDALPPTTPGCDGTLRFSIAADERMYQTALRLHRPDLWTSVDAWKDTAAKDMDADEAAFRNRHGAAIAKARTALTAYYVAAFHLAPTLAARDAHGALNNVISNAFGQC